MHRKNSNSKGKTIRGHRHRIGSKTPTNIMAEVAHNQQEHKPRAANSSDSTTKKQKVISRVMALMNITKRVQMKSNPNPVKKKSPNKTITNRGITHLAMQEVRIQEMLVKVKIEPHISNSACLGDSKLRVDITHSLTSSLILEIIVLREIKEHKA